MQLNNAVAKIISAMVHNPVFEAAVKEKIGTNVDTAELEEQITALQAKVKQAVSIKNRLGNQMDALDFDDVHYERKMADLQRRYDGQYDIIGELEEQIKEIQNRITLIQQEKISADNIYKLLLLFDELYGCASEAEQKQLMRAFVERIELFPERRKDGNWIKKIVFNFPIPVEGGFVKELSLEGDTTIETVVLFSKG